VPLPPPTWLQNLAAAGELLSGLGALSLFLALWIFIRDRRASDRAQIDQLAAWAEAIPDAFELTEGQPFWVNARVFLRNASTLPIEIVHVGVNVQSTWRVPDHEQSGKLVPIWEPVEGIKESPFFFGRFRLPPDDTHVQSHQKDLSDDVPPESVGLWYGNGLVCDFRTILVTDNAGRRWRIRPGRGGPAKRLRWYSRQRDEYEPLPRSLVTYIVDLFRRSVGGDLRALVRIAFLCLIWGVIVVAAVAVVAILRQRF
jgi:hypothetical protein